MKVRRNMCVSARMWNISVKKKTVSQQDHLKRLRWVKFCDHQLWIKTDWTSSGMWKWEENIWYEGNFNLPLVLWDQYQPSSKFVLFVTVVFLQKQLYFRTVFNTSLAEHRGSLKMFKCHLININIRTKEFTCENAKLMLSAK